MRIVSLVGFALAGLMSDAARASCPVFDVSADQAATAVRGFQLAVADEALAEALTAVACAEVDDPKRLARLLRIHGARRFFDDDVAGAERYFAAAQALDGDAFEAETWGDEALALWRAAEARRWGEGTLAVLVPEGASIVVDGRPGQNPAKVAAIPHVVRLGAFAARVADVQPEATTVVDLSAVDLTPRPPPVVVVAPPPTALAAPPRFDAASSVAGLTLPITHDRGRHYVDANGRLVADQELARIVGGAGDGRYLIANERLAAHRLGNALPLGFGAVGLAIAGVAAPVYAVNVAKYHAQFDDPTSDCVVFGTCRRKPEDMLILSVTLGSMGAVTASGGLINLAGMPRLHRKAAEAANIGLAEIAAGGPQAASESE